MSTSAGFDYANVLKKVKSLKVYSIGEEYFSSDCRLTSVCSQEEIIELMKGYECLQFNPAILDKVIDDFEPYNKRIMWKGGRLVLMEYNNGDVILVLISDYGAFFKLFCENIYFVIAPDKTSDQLWKEELDRISVKFVDSHRSGDVEPTETIEVRYNALFGR